MVTFSQLAGQLCPAFIRYKGLLDGKQQGQGLDPSSPSAVLKEFRLMRHKLWLGVAVECFENHRPPMEICQAWTQSADQIIQQAWAEAGCDRLPLSLFAMGKLGAQELNLSSDVDLVVVSATTAEPNWDRPLRLFNNLLNQVNEWGFCLRTDFDLRPGGRFSPLITSLAQFENHYWSQGETWERLALVRLRFLAGHSSLAESVLELAHRFTYRRYLDYTLFEDLKQLRSRIHRHQNSQALQSPNEPIHLKLGIGGIRDIELFIHSLQVIHGGRQIELRQTSTDQAIDALIRHKILPEADLEFLRQAYWQLRDFENLAQIREDRQTHFWDPHMSLARKLYPSYEQLQELMKSVDQIVSDLLGRAKSESDDLPIALEHQQDWLRQMAYSPHSVEDIWPALIDKGVLAQDKSARERNELTRRQFLKAFIIALNKIDLNKDLGLHLLLDFIRSTRAKSSFFSLLLREPRLIEDLARLFSSSPYLGGIIARRPELIDSFVLRYREAFSEDLEQMLEEITEHKLLAEIFSANRFLQDFDVQTLILSLSETADQLVSALLVRLKQDYPGSGLEVLALGKWGGREVGLRSDLDLIFVCPQKPLAEDYKVARRLISRLTEAHRGGQIYSVDLRLRPSGSSGPLLVSLDDLGNFLQHEADPWLRQSYLKARFLSGKSAQSIHSQVIKRGLKSSELSELKNIRQRLLATTSDSTKIDLKKSPGGLIDIEFACQIACLTEQIQPSDTSTLALLDSLALTLGDWRLEAAELKKIYLKLRRTEQILQISTSHSGSMLCLDQEEFSTAAKLQNEAPKELFEKIRRYLAHGQEIVKNLDPIYRSQ